MATNPDATVPEPWCISRWISNARSSIISIWWQIRDGTSTASSCLRSESWDMRFGRDPITYVSFVHNFETCLEKDNTDNSRRLQLLIQHCYWKARDAIESCVNLPVDEGYHVAKSTLRENFGLPHNSQGTHQEIGKSTPPEASRWSKFTCICLPFRCSQ